MPDKSLQERSILLQFSTERTNKHAGMCKWVVQMCLFGVNLPVAKGTVEYSGLGCGEKLLHMSYYPMLHTITTVSVNAVIKSVHSPSNCRAASYG